MISKTICIPSSYREVTESSGTNLKLMSFLALPLINNIRKICIIHQITRN